MAVIALRMKSVYMIPHSEISSVSSCINEVSLTGM